MESTKKTQKSARSRHAAAKAEDELTHDNVRAIAKIEERAKASGSISDRIAELIAGFSGSMTFVWINVVWFGAWISYNTLVDAPFDPFPFTFLTLMVSLEAILLSIFILINQNRETAIAQRRNHLDLQVNLLSEQENTRMLNFLEAIAEKVGVELDSEEFRSDMTEDIDPEKIMAHIVRETEDHTH